MAIYKFTLQFWSLLLSALTTLTVIIGAIIAIANLRTISKARKADSIKDFMESLHISREDRKFVLRDFEFRPNNFNESTKLTHETEMRVQRVVNSLNYIGLLVERRLLSPRLVFGICYPTIIRCEEKLRAYINYHERLIGGRYGRRVFRIVHRAKTYHDCHPQHRATVILNECGSTKKSYIVYETKIFSGIRGAIQKIMWIIRRVLHLY